MVKEEERRESFRLVYSGNWKVSICYRVLLFFFFFKRELKRSGEIFELFVTRLFIAR